MDGCRHLLRAAARNPHLHPTWLLGSQKLLEESLGRAESETWSKSDTTEVQ